LFFLLSWCGIIGVYEKEKTKGKKARFLQGRIRLGRKKEGGPSKKKVAKEKPIGRVSHYFDKIKVAAIKLKAPVKKGDTIRIEGGNMVVKQKISSMQKNHKPVATAKARDEIGIKISKKVREGYRVFKV